MGGTPGDTPHQRDAGEGGGKDATDFFLKDATDSQIKIKKKDATEFFWRCGKDFVSCNSEKMISRIAALPAVLYLLGGGRIYWVVAGDAINRRLYKGKNAVWSELDANLF